MVAADGRLSEGAGRSDHEQPVVAAERGEDSALGRPVRYRGHPGREGPAIGLAALNVEGIVIAVTSQHAREELPFAGAIGRFRRLGERAALKLLGHDTNESIMLFEETVPPGTKSLFHLHRDSDEVAWVLAGEITFKIGDDVTVGGPGTCAFFPRNVPHAWKSSGSETGRVLFMYTPASAGGLIEEMSEHGARPMTDEERNAMRERHRWEVVGPNPL